MKFEEVLPALRAGKKVIRKNFKDWDAKYGDVYIAIAKPEMRSHKYIKWDELLLWSNSPHTCYATSIRDGHCKNDQQAGIIARDGEFYAIEWKTMSFEILEDDFEVIDES